MTPKSSFPSSSARSTIPRGPFFGAFEATLKQHLLGVFVAVLFAISALEYGGFPPEVTAGISIFAWWTIILGAVTGLLPIGHLCSRSVIVVLLFLALAVLTALSVTWAVDGGRAFTKAVQFTAVFGLFVLALLTSKPASARGWAAGITSGLLVIVLLAALSRFIPGIGDDVELTVNLSGVQGRLSWPLGYWNALGACAAMCAVGLGWFGTHARGANLRALSIAALPLTGLVIYLTSSRGAVVALALGVVVLMAFGPRRRTLAAGIGAGLAGAIVLILIAAQMYALVHAEAGSDATKQGWILLAASIAAIVATWLAWRRLEPLMGRLTPWKAKRWQLVAGAILILATVIAINPVRQYDQFTSPVAATATAPGSEENTTTAHLLSAGGTGRADYWSNAVDAFVSQPVRGIGAGGFETFYAENRDSGLTGRHTHSLVLQVLAELGIIGALLLVSILGVTMLTAWQRWQVGSLSSGSGVFANSRASDSDSDWRVIPVLLAIAATGSFSMSIDWTAEFPIIAAPIAIAIAGLVGPATRPDLPTTRASRESIAPDLLAALLILVGGLSIWMAASGFGMATKMNSSRDAVSAGNLPLAASEAKAAIDALPPASEPRIQLALVQELQGEYQQALGTVNDAIERAPETSSSHLLKARILIRLDRDAAGERAYETARTFDPNGLIFADDPAPADEDSG